jgi:hypothetical protein
MNRSILPVALVVAFLTACAALQPGADPIAVRAEQSRSIAFLTFDTFLKFEYDNRALLAGTPEIHAAAEHIRVNGPKWIDDLTALIVVYKANRTPENKANLATGLAVLNTALVAAEKYLSEASLKKKG